MKDKIRALWQTVSSWWLRTWEEIRPGPEAGRGVVWGARALAVAMAVWVGWNFNAGLTTAGDLAVAIVLTLVLIWLSGQAARPIFGLLRMIPGVVLGTLIGALALLSFPMGGHQLALVSLAIAAVLGATLFSLGHGSKARRIVNYVLLGLSAIGAGALIWVWSWAGYDKDAADAPISKQPVVAALDVPNPGEAGPFKVVAFTYGAGTDKHRREYGAGATLKSRSVDGSKVLKEKEGWRGKVRQWYWGFGADKLPLNARVWMPDGPGPFPLVLVVHGNHRGEEYSDPGYAYLGELLASRGFILASIDENFLNGSWSGDYNTKEQPARGWMLLEHLKLWREWNGTKGHRLEGKVDLNRVALMGHSRGGEAAATATAFNRLPCFPGDCNQKFDYGFNIRSVIAIAPSDGQYKPAGMWRPLRDVNYFVIQGGYDFDVSSFDGARQYDRTTFSPGFDGFKAELWIYRANHGQFNTVWGQWDGSGPSAWLLNLKPLVSGEQQRQVAKVYFSAFLEATLNGKREYVPLFEDYRRGAKWLPDTTYLNRYQDGRYHAIAEYDEDFNLRTATDGGVLSGENLKTWKEERVNLRWGDRVNNGVFLGWRKPASYTIEPKEPVEGMLVFSLADVNEDPPKDKDDKSKDPEAPKKKPALELSVELVREDGTVKKLALKDAGPVYPPLRIDYEKWKVPFTDRYKKDTEPVLQRYRIPLEGKVKAVRLRFDRSAKGTVVVDDAGVETAK